MPQRKILLIEDDGFLASIYARAFEQSGFEVSFAGGGADGLKLAAKDVPDLVVLDLNMMPMDGFEVLERLKADDATKKIPVFILTNLATKEDVDRCLALGAVGYAIKAHTLPHEVVKKAKEILHVDV